MNQTVFHFLRIAFILPWIMLCAAKTYAAVPAPAQTNGQTIKIAVIDLQRAMTQTEDGLRAQATLKKLFDRRQQEINRKEQELMKQKQEIEKSAKKDAFQDQKFQERAQNWQNQMMNLEKSRIHYQSEIRKKETELTKPIHDRMMKIIKKIGLEGNYEEIRDKEVESRLILWSRKKTDDITDQCIQLYNKGRAPSKTVK